MTSSPIFLMSHQGDDIASVPTEKGEKPYYSRNHDGANTAVTGIHIKIADQSQPFSIAYIDDFLLA